LKQLVIYMWYYSNVLFLSIGNNCFY
jgi:hypothetical protein